MSLLKINCSLLKLLNPKFKIRQSVCIFNDNVKFYSVKSGRFYFERLKDKSLIQVKGADSATFLQSLVTNDINSLASDDKAVYSMFLNNKGRVMFDTIIVKGVQDKTFFIECESGTAHQLEKHMKKYKLRKKVSFKVIEEELTTYVVYSLDEIFNSIPDDLLRTISNDPSLKHFFNDSISDLKLNDLNFGDSISYRDPRLDSLGIRLIVPSECDISDLNKGLTSPEGVELYRMCRYWLGIAEGRDELPYEQCFPLESNCDYLHGVSFIKGCYIGQELTARSHHTGVIRKRIMPITFKNPVTDLDLSQDITLDFSPSSKKVGKLRGAIGKYGIALLRIADCLKLPRIHSGDKIINCYKPLWWPPQEGIKLSKSEVT